jgi:hypothetical protein
MEPWNLVCFIFISYGLSFIFYFRAVWFKVAEQGLVNGKWAATDILKANNWVYSFKLPASLAPGQYIVRYVKAVATTFEKSH